MVILWSTQICFNFVEVTSISKDELQVQSIFCVDADCKNATQKYFAFNDVKNKNNIILR